MQIDKDEANAVRAFFQYGAILALVFVFMSVLNPPSKKAHNPQKAYSSHEITAEMFTPPPNVDPATKAESEPTEQQVEQWRSERSDLAAQWETADMAHLAFRMGVLGMILLGWTIFETRNASDAASRTLKIAQESLVLARDTAEKQLRAYVDVSCRLTVLEGARIKIQVKVQNMGQTPAIRVGIECEEIKIGNHLLPCGGKFSMRENFRCDPGKHLNFPFFAEESMMASLLKRGVSFKYFVTFTDIYGQRHWERSKVEVLPERIPIDPTKREGIGFSILEFEDDLEHEAKAYKKNQK